ncbi:hypothetical protein X777_16706 [Ooceraea biroi]|uniref:Uncharacterized protein n=1 Tax=Ooceraea biroi TaxID=2015173 RepID=A0A026VW47_OOCBI|nr:hypothetical protein X777_16706 [Ooceraea biroi]
MAGTFLSLLPFRQALVSWWRSLATALLAHGDSRCPMNALHFHTSPGGQRERLTRLFNPRSSYHSYASLARAFLRIVLKSMQRDRNNLTRGTGRLRCKGCCGSMDHHRGGDHAVKLMPSAYQWPDTSAPKVPGQALVSMSFKTSRSKGISRRSIERDESRWQTRYPPPPMRRLFLIEKSGKDGGMRAEEKIGSVTDTWCDDSLPFPFFLYLSFLSLSLEDLVPWLETKKVPGSGR